jgi:chromosome segregation ATPase
MKSMPIKPARYGWMLRWAGAVLAAGWLTGCETYQPSGPTGRAAQASQREDLLLIQENLRQTRGQVEDLSMQVDSMRQERMRSGQDQNRLVEDRLRTLHDRIGELERRMSSLEATQQRDKQEIIDKLSDRIAQVMQRSAPASSSSVTPSKKKSASATGYEHVVQPGETLSEIAKAYGVSVSVIIRENNLQKPDQLRVGQKLFIPE